SSATTPSCTSTTPRTARTRCTCAARPCSPPSRSEEPNLRKGKRNAQATPDPPAVHGEGRHLRRARRLPPVDRRQEPVRLRRLPARSTTGDDGAPLAARLPARRAAALGRRGP